ncbi:MAG TPA: hypothetical protein VGL07_13295 [Buttiauxella sp.]|jgi:hypothetical protein
MNIANASTNKSTFNAENGYEINIVKEKISDAQPQAIATEMATDLEQNITVARPSSLVRTRHLGCSKPLKWFVGGMCIAGGATGMWAQSRAGGNVGLRSAGINFGIGFVSGMVAGSTRDIPPPFISGLTGALFSAIPSLISLYSSDRAQSACASVGGGLNGAVIGYIATHIGR